MMEVALVFRRSWIAAALLSAILMAGSASAADTKQPEVYSFGTLKAAPAETVRTQAQQWLAGAGKTDEATRKQFDAIWSQDRPLLDKVSATLSLEPTAAKLLTDVNNPALSVPTDASGSAAHGRPATAPATRTAAPPSHPRRPGTGGVRRLPVDEREGHPEEAHGRIRPDGPAASTSWVGCCAPAMPGARA